MCDFHSDMQQDDMSFCCL